MISVSLNGIDPFSINSIVLELSQLYSDGKSAIELNGEHLT